MFLVAATKQNISAALCFDVLYSMLDVFKAYFGDFWPSAAQSVLQPGASCNQKQFGAGCDNDVRVIQVISTRST